MKRNNGLMVIGMLLVTTYIGAESPLYLSKIINQTDNTLFKSWFAKEQYEVIIFPNSTSNLGQWFNFQVQKNLIIAPQKGDGFLPIFIEYGPEPSIECAQGMMPHSLIYWQGSQSTLTENKSYQAFCQTDKNPSVQLLIKPDLTVEIAPDANIKKVLDFE